MAHPSEHAVDSTVNVFAYPMRSLLRTINDLICESHTVPTSDYYRWWMYLSWLTTGEIWLELSSPVKLLTFLHKLELHP